MQLGGVRETRRGNLWWVQVSGQLGMPSFKIRPKAMSYHGRQLIQGLSRGGATHFNVARQSRLSTGSIRHNLEVSSIAMAPPVS